LEIFGFVYPANNDIQLSGGEGAIYRLHITTSRDLPADLCTRPTETEPNNSINEANSLEFGTQIIGTINSPRDEDRFRFTAIKDETYEFSVAAASLGSPLDCWLKSKIRPAKKWCATMIPVAPAIRISSGKRQ